jgi:hypothetical protein
VVDIRDLSLDQRLSAPRVFNDLADDERQSKASRNQCQEAPPYRPRGYRNRC